MLARVRRTIALQITGAACLAIALTAILLHTVVGGDLDRLLRATVLAELAGCPAALAVGRSVARRAVAPLSDALERRRRLVAEASHELRAPLTRLHVRAQLLSQRLRQGALVPGDVPEEMDRLVAGTGRLSEVVEDVLRSEQLAGRRRPAVPVDLAALAEEQAEAESARARACGVAVEVSRLDRGDHMVCGAAPALRRVISALLDNALCHTRTGGHIRVTLCRGPGGTVELSVRDDGTGLDPATAERLFARHIGEGSGLGLALVREIMEAHGGTVTATGRPGAGAAFTVRLPALPGPRRVIPWTPPSTPSRSGSPANPRLR
ncbi:hypothetical protein Acsp03_26970 [Actinomadura sp. NBRC 104412]|uniref:sensor histidine kinase n=1 Tax=Actinomadura sp. NBRC 104412 TaxID=3032203 RepID=UPI0024A1A888|nr:HAMP domain-containing sensor histidine kinase [Actinomadura sp. NBRC 104412]GLZ05231.1 hypothetical protein Acsp03_26970 [Actinomadura sp. NBRC 104412]